MRVILFVLLYFVIGCQPQASTVALPDFTQLVEQQGQAVVNISTVQKAPEVAQPQVPEMFRRFFGDDFGELFRAPRPDGQSLGSGFFISSDGYVLTNHHVVNGADTIMVKLQDGRELAAELLGSDPRSDLAVLKIEGKDFPAVKVGSSANLKVGEWVLAIGSPFGFESTVTAGIVSAKGRSLPNENYVPFIQTDVAINPGNSGGPLFNLDGEVVGINSQIISRSGGFMGLSFAIPMDLAMDVVNQLKDKGKVSRGWLGVVIQNVDRGLAESFGLPKPAGALVSQVLPDSAADKAGIQVGDVIIRFNGQEIGPSGQLPHVVGAIAPGTKVEAVVVRQGKTRTLKVTVAELEEDQLASGSSERSGQGGQAPFGLTVAALTTEEKTRLKLEHGVKVTAVTGAAQRAGLRPGDVIESINQQPLKEPKDLARIEKAAKGAQSVPVLLYRDGQPRFIPLRLAE